MEEGVLMYHFTLEHKKNAHICVKGWYEEAGPFRTLSLMVVCLFLVTVCAASL